jgi:Threonine dehydrogenase and related Zn-dependent dehydrogenases
MNRNTAVAFTGENLVELREPPVPEPAAGEVLIRTRRTLISTGTELTCLGRRFEPGSHWDQWVKYPFFPGYSNAGVVVKTGAGVTAFKPGDRVASRAAHQRFVVAPEDALVRIPDAVSDDEAVWFGIACIVQNGVRRARHELGDAVVVIGLGLLGQLAVQFTRLLGAREIIAIDTAPRRLEFARAHGATLALEKSAADARADVLAATGGRLADVVYDVTGHPAVLPHTFPLTRTLGKIVLLGDAGNPTQQHLTGELISRGLGIIGAHDNNPPKIATDADWWTRNHMADLFMTYLAQRRMRVADLVTHRFAPAQAAEAYRRLVEDRSTAMGVVFDWDAV